MSPLSQGFVNGSAYHNGSPRTSPRSQEDTSYGSGGGTPYSNGGRYGGSPGENDYPVGRPDYRRGAEYNRGSEYGDHSGYRGEGDGCGYSDDAGYANGPAVYPGIPDYGRPNYNRTPSSNRSPSSQTEYHPVPAYNVPSYSAFKQYLDQPDYFADPFGMDNGGQSLDPGHRWQLSSMRLQQDGSSPPSSDWGHRVSERRANVYEAVQALASNDFDNSDAQDFFTFNDGQGKTFELKGSRRYQIPFQWYHSGRGAIPARLADKAGLRSVQGGVNWVLEQLNAVFGTDRVLEEPGMGQMLQDFVAEDFDFGRIYGHLRPWWFSKLTVPDVRLRMQKRKSDDWRLRSAAMDGDCIVDPAIPPRRIWDLYSNRVVPYYVLDISHPRAIPENVWAVSHSWVEPGQRAHGLTTINGQEWPVPIPGMVSLNDVRIELLNLGAEYVFLDVLCLRQKVDMRLSQHPYLLPYSPPRRRGEQLDPNDFRRRREWRLDVPTIGRVYQHYPRQTTITYFNGLGLPFSTSPDAMRSETHWFKRVWTLQETTLNWMPGGLTATPFGRYSQQDMTPPDFGDKLRSILRITMRQQTDVFVVIRIIRDRAFSNQADRVSGLAYLLRCNTMPIYEPEALDVEDAWDTLVEHMDPKLRIDLLMGWDTPGWGRYSWCPTWAQLMTWDNVKSWATVNYGPREPLQYSILGCLDGSDTYYHYAFFIEDGVSVVASLQEQGRSQTFIAIDGTPEMPLHEYQPIYDAFCLIAAGDSGSWLIGAVNGTRTINGEMALSVAKRGVLRFNSHNIAQSAADISSGTPDTLIMYT